MERINSFVGERDYWLKHLAGQWLRSSFAYDCPEKRETGEKKMEFVATVFTPELYNQLMRLSNGSDVRLFVILSAALYVLLHRYTGHSDLVVGVPVFTQDSGTDLDNTLLPLRVDAQETATGRQLILKVRETLMQGIDHYGYPIDLLADQLNLSNSEAGSPLFDVAVLLENIQKKDYLRGVSPALVFTFCREEDRLVLRLEYNSSLYLKESIERICGNYLRGVEQLALDTEGEIGEIDCLTPEERERLLVEFNNTAAEYSLNNTFHVLFQEQVARTPHRAAVVFRGQWLTYEKLNGWANRLGRLLREKGGGGDKVTAILAERSAEMFAGILGILKAGSAYLPLDPAYPLERIEFMLQNSRSNLLVRQPHVQYEPQFDGGIITIYPGENETAGEENLDNINRSTDLAYVIYTSGTTGKPKGVMVQHDQFINVAFGWRDQYHLDAMEVNLLQIAGFSFDVFAGDIARAFLNGGKLVLSSEEERLDFPSLHSLLLKHRITLFESIPSLVVPFMDYVYDNHLGINHLKLLIIGSDVCRSRDFRRLVDRLCPIMRIVNSYGVTEATIDTSFYEEGLEKINPTGTVPIGRPLPNMRCYILDTRGRLQPIGVIGELFIGGSSVARGYINDYPLTQQRFLPDPFVAGGRMYKTGDLARWLPDGNIEFCGRQDQQVKIRGYRIEMAEIENHLLNVDGIKEVVVQDRRDKFDEKYLCAYIVTEAGLDFHRLRAYLLAKLPAFMIPAYFVPVKRLPLTANGKIDKRALPDPISTFRSMTYLSERDLLDPANRTAEENRIPDTTFSQEEEPYELSNREREQVLNTFNDTAADFTAHRLIFELFEDQVEMKGDHTAIVYEEQHLTYDRLNRAANQSARCLRAGGVRANSIVGLMVGRSNEMMIGIMAILKAGAAFLPLEPDAPEKRALFMIQDSGVEWLLCNGSVKRAGHELHVLNLNNEDLFRGPSDNLKPVNGPTDLSHVLYTSGTTGEPKGVLLEHRSVVNLMAAVAELLFDNETHNVASFTPVTFDVFSAETILPLTRGSKVLIGSDEAVLDYRSAAVMVEKEKVTVYQSTPSVLQLVVGDELAAGSLAGLRYLLSAGEPLLPELLDQIKQHTDAAIYNLYGPTEATIYSTAKDVSGKNTLNIGKPINNTRIYIVNHQGEPRPVEKTGELCIGGIGVGRGYLNRVPLTAEKFMTDPFVPGDRVYKTGDLSRWTPDGDIEFLGRADLQIKIGGFRIEPGEIENRIISYDGVKEAAVVARRAQAASTGAGGGGDRKLLAFVVAEHPLSEVQLKEFLARQLPYYMIPNSFIQLEKMPLTPNRKIDRRLLGVLEIAKGRATPYSVARNQVEKELVTQWADILGIDREVIGINDNFFDLGGNSLLVIRLNSRLKKLYKREIPVVSMFQYTDISSFARYLTAEESPPETVADDSPEPVNKGRDRLRDLKSRMAGL